MEYKFIAIKLSTYRRFRRTVKPYPNEKMVSYFERISKLLEGGLLQ